MYRVYYPCRFERNGFLMVRCILRMWIIFECQEKFSYQFWDGLVNELIQDLRNIPQALEEFKKQRNA
jgi:hypothetical protein